MSDDLVTLLIADAEPFARGCDHAQSLADKLEHHLRESASEIAASFAAGFAIEKVAERAIDVVKEAFEAMKHQMEDLVEMAHLADRTGIGIDSLRALRHEAKLSGVEFQTLQGNIKKMQQNLGESVLGGPKAKVFEQLGLDPAALAAMSPESAFAKIGDAIGAIENPTSRVHMAFEVFGKTGAEALNVIMQGSHGLADAQQHVGRVSEESVQQMERYHRATIELDEAWAKLARTGAEKLAPQMAGMAERMIPLVSQTTAGLSALMDVVGGIVEKGARFQDPAAMAAKDEADKARKAKDEGKAKAAEAAEVEMARQEKEAKELERLQKDAAQEDAKQDQAAQHLREQVHPEEKLHREQVDAGGLFLSGKIDADELSDALADAAKRFQDEMDKRDPLKALKKEAEHLLDELPENKFEKRMREIKDANDAGLLTPNEANALNDKAVDEFRKSQGIPLDKDHTKAHTRIEGPSAITDQGQAYTAFFKALQPNVDAEDKKQTDLQQKILDTNKQQLAIIQKVYNNQPVVQVASF